MEYKLTNDAILEYFELSKPEFPKYTSQLINWANQNAQGTRPRVVGQLSDLFPEFLETAEETSVDSWRQWYQERYPEAIETATDKIYAQVKNLKDAIQLIDKDMVEAWVNDLVIEKTYSGLYFQKAILAHLSQETGQPYRLATPEEEALGIDGYVGNVAYSIKPDSYQVMERILPEEINVRMIYYSKKGKDFVFSVEE